MTGIPNGLQKRLCCTACGRRENPPVLKKHLFVAGISKIGIKRVGTRIKIAIYTAKPGMVIGRGGTGIEDIKRRLPLLPTKKSILISLKLNPKI